MEFFISTSGFWIYIGFVYFVDWISDWVWRRYVDWRIRRLDAIIGGEQATALDKLGTDLWSRPVDWRLAHPAATDCDERGPDVSLRSGRAIAGARNR